MVLQALVAYIQFVFIIRDLKFGRIFYEELVCIRFFDEGTAYEPAVIIKTI